jgi:hypothetical protein
MLKLDIMANKTALTVNRLLRKAAVQVVHMMSVTAAHRVTVKLRVMVLDTAQA